MNNIKNFTNENDYINFISNYEGDLISPGGAAHLVGVTRGCITNWMHRDGKIRAYVYVDPMGDKYTFVDKQDVIKARLNTRNKNTIGDSLVNKLINELNRNKR